MRSRRLSFWSTMACACVVGTLVAAVAEGQHADSNVFVVNNAAVETAPADANGMDPPVRLDPGVNVRRVAVVDGPDGPILVERGTVSGRAVACEDDPSAVYCNTLGSEVFGPSDSLYNARFADDVSTVGVPGCLLDRYVIKVTGDKYQDGSGSGAYTVEVGLFDACPGAGGDAIPGTTKQIPIDAASASDILEIEISPMSIVELPTNFYVGVKFSRKKCGTVVGAPATLGFSTDRFDFPGFPCAAGLGGFPNGPHASFYAEIYVQGECPSTFVGYKNSNHAGAQYSAGVGARFADDIILGVSECTMVAWEFAHRGNGVVGLDLRTHLDNADPVNGSLIPGTRSACFSSGDDVQICRFDFAEPIPLSQSNIFAVYRASSDVVGPLLTCKMANPGSTENLFLVYTGSEWTPMETAGQCWAAFELTIFCEGTPPLGACCDMYLKDEENEAVCRDSVAEMNCATPELWVEDGRCGAFCEDGEADGEPCTGQSDCCDADCVDFESECVDLVCVGGPRDGQSCTTTQECTTVCVGGPRDGEPCNNMIDCIDSICVGSFCEGGENDGQVCTRQADCPGGDCMGPFLHPCGTSACCEPDGSCENLTENQCSEVPPVEDPRMYQQGQFCGEYGQRCPIPACLGRVGECTLPREAFCVGPPLDGTDCRPDEYPDPCDSFGCVGGSNNGQPCTPDNVECPDGICTVANVCEGGSNNGLPCTPDVTECPTPGNCEWITEAQCIGGKGCEDPYCCTDVCSIMPYCCAVWWDELCAAEAFVVCERMPANDECYDPEPRVGARLITIPSVVESDGIHATASSTDPGFCCDIQDPGARGIGTVWYKFVATDTSARLDTCCSVARAGGPADDSLIQVFAVVDPDRGICGDGLTLCSVSAQDCLDGSTCELDEQTACANLMPIACSDDDDPCSCHGYPNPELSKICVTDLVPGDMYYVMVGGKDEVDDEGAQMHRGVYQLRIVSPCFPLEDPLPNDLCMNATVLTGEHVVEPFDLSGGEEYAEATFDCPKPPATCMITLQNDIWYDWIAPCNGTVVVQTCDDVETDPDTGLALYDGCDCPVQLGTEIQCSDFMPDPCFLASKIGHRADKLINVVEGNCYKIRLGGHLGGTPAGPLRIDVECVRCPVPVGLVTFDPPDGVVDARQPSPPGDAANRQGIDTFEINAPSGAAESCWTLCETAADGSANDFDSIVDNGDDTYTITLTRTITTGAVTTITYTDDNDAVHRGVFTSHPANVNGDSQAAPSDILEIIDYINGVRVSPFGIYSEDIDQSGVLGPPDILRVIDLLNGAGVYDPWLNTPLPECGVCCP